MMTKPITLLLLSVSAAMAADAMPAAQQNAMIQKYCVVCHSDEKMIGGLTLVRFDAAHPDPGMAAMLAAKLKDGAMGASGIKVPDRATEASLLSALLGEAAGADAWVVNRTPALTASIVQKGASNLYRLTLTCRDDTREGDIQLAWSPGDVAGGSARMSASVDGKTPSTYQIVTGEGHAILNPTLPEQSLKIGSLPGSDSIVFPFESLTKSVRDDLSRCFTTSPGTR